MFKRFLDNIISVALFLMAIPFALIFAPFVLVFALLLFFHPIGWMILFFLFILRHSNFCIGCKYSSCDREHKE